MLTMIAKKSCRYGTRRLVAGDEFTVTGESERRTYRALGWADDKPAERTLDEHPQSREAPEAAAKPAAKKAAAKKVAAKTAAHPVGSVAGFFRRAEAEKAPDGGDENA